MFEALHPVTAHGEASARRQSAHLLSVGTASETLMIGWNRAFRYLLIIGVIGLAATVGEASCASRPAADRSGRAGPAAPPREVSAVTPRGPIRLTATPPKIASPEPAANTSDVKARYVGSLACQRCHAAMYERWTHTRMANVITDPKANPAVVIGDFSKTQVAVTFKVDEVAFVYGTKWKQRYFLRKDNDALSGRGAVGCGPTGSGDLDFVQPNTDWWVAALSGATWGQFFASDRTALRRLPLDQLQRRDQTGDRVGTSAARNVTARRASTSPVRRRPTSSTRRGSTTCAPTTRACSAIRRVSRSRTRSPKIRTTTGPWDSIRASSRRISGSWRSTRPARRPFTHYPEGTAHKNRMQGNDFVESPMHRRRRHVLQLPRDRTALRTTPTSSSPRSSCASPATARIRRTVRERRPGRSPHAPCGRQSRQPVHRVPHAEGGADDRRRQRPEPHLQVHYAGHDRALQDPQPLHDVSHDADDRMGEGTIEDMDQRLALESAVDGCPALDGCHASPLCSYLSRQLRPPLAHRRRAVVLASPRSWSNRPSPGKKTPPSSRQSSP